MSTQASPLPSSPEIQNHKSLLDEPWKVTLIPAAAPVGEDPHAARSLPWRVGDVTRLKDDSPKGMMEYIATHSTGWWREMAQRALRDTEKAERMAREQGWEYGQYWALEVDAEAKQKLLEAEEARHAREEAARAKEEAEKQAFIQRQMELLERAGRAPRCEYQYTDGRGCKSPQVKGERWCHGHAKMMSYRPEKLEILPMEDEQAVMVNLYRVTNSLLAGRISEKVAGLMLWSVAIGAPGAAKLSPQRSRRAQRRKTLPLMNSDHTDFKKKDEQGAHSDSGVTNDKSFVSGVEGRVPPGGRTRDSKHRENSLNRRGHDRHSRGPSTPPHSHCSLGVRRDDSGKGHRQTWSDVDATDTEHFSVSPCLSGEKTLSAGENSSASPRLGGEIELGGEIKSIGGSEIASFRAGE